MKALDAGAWFGSGFTGRRIPTLIEFLLRYSGYANLHIELKSHAPEPPSKVAKLLVKTGWV
jgi:glycerophosphoryl diester phosphodiesterase